MFYNNNDLLGISAKSVDTLRTLYNKFGFRGREKTLPLGGEIIPVFPNNDIKFDYPTALFCLGCLNVSNKADAPLRDNKKVSFCVPNGYRAIVLTKYCLILESNQNIVVAFRGTHTITEWLENLEFAQTPLLDAYNIPSPDYLVHQGFYQVYQELIRDFNIELSRQAPSLYEEVAKFPLTIVNNSLLKTLLYLINKQARNIIITGHSLGSAAATLLAFQLKTGGLPPRPDISVYTFGSPRIGNVPFSAAYDRVLGNCTFRVVNANDIVPTVPPRYLAWDKIKEVLEKSWTTPFSILTGVLPGYIKELSTTEAFSHVGLECVLSLFDQRSELLPASYDPFTNATLPSRSRITFPHNISTYYNLLANIAERVQLATQPKPLPLSTPPWLTNLCDCQGTDPHTDVVYLAFCPNFVPISTQAVPLIGLYTYFPPGWQIATSCPNIGIS
ncbi:MAG: hypothetical protein RLZ12_564 [Bacillota bacterium]|jgi:hypothetical protein